MTRTWQLASAVALSGYTLIAFFLLATDTLVEGRAVAALAKMLIGAVAAAQVARMTWRDFAPSRNGIAP